ncbi:hypothetical protein O0235_08250 [Tepidiforma flava]|uniref:Poly(3-hydroxyalkanoate) polymerase subunit PhaE n=1 Tax=Tepidiforma flava TaxID=3004094 RepID=A0ABY7M218_9CHLR|nr:hypothetical protein [Tepidiforma flava]WBL34786.1 hypothetical protein O0235_08250 [Tepidiforma flava]
MTQPGPSPFPGPEELLKQFQQLNEQFLSAWGKTYESFMASAAGQEASKETQQAYVATRAALARAAREAWGPLIEAAGAVPLTEFQRLADQVQLLLERLDAVDDRLEEIAGMLREAGKGKGKKKAQG